MIKQRDSALARQAASQVAPARSQQTRQSTDQRSTGLSLADSYRPENVSYTERNGRPVRAYLMPHSGKTIYLGRSCGKCSQAHFDFEHDHMAKVKTEMQYSQAFLAQTELDLAKAYGYAVLVGEPLPSTTTTPRRA